MALKYGFVFPLLDVRTIVRLGSNEAADVAKRSRQGLPRID